MVTRDTEKLSSTPALCWQCLREPCLSSPPCNPCLCSDYEKEGCELLGSQNGVQEEEQAQWEGRERNQLSYLAVQTAPLDKAASQNLKAVEQLPVKTNKKLSLWKATELYIEKWLKWRHILFALI